MLQLGFATHRQALVDTGDLLVATNCHADRGYLVLSGHADTVHPKESSFTSLTTKGELLTGPGVLDMKGGLVVLLWALEALSNIGALSTLPIKIIINPEEEQGSTRSRAAIEQAAAGSAVALVFEWARAQYGVITKRKGIMSIALRAKGRKAHSGNAHRNGRNAIDALARCIPLLHAITNYDDEITVSVNQIQGGTSLSTVPDYAEAMCDIRIPNANAGDSVLRKIEEVLGAAAPEGTVIDAIERVSIPALEETKVSKELADNFVRLAPSCGYTSIVSPTLYGGASDANIFGGMGIPTIDGLGPFGDGAHTDTEYIEVDSLLYRTEHLVRWILQGAFCNVSV